MHASPGFVRVPKDAQQPQISNVPPQVGVNRHFQTKVQEPGPWLQIPGLSQLDTPDQLCVTFTLYSRTGIFMGSEH